MSDEPISVENVYEHALFVMEARPDVTSVGIAVREVDGEPFACATGCIIDLDGDPITAETIAELDDDGTLTAMAGIRAVRLAAQELDDVIAEWS